MNWLQTKIARNKLESEANRLSRAAFYEAKEWAKSNKYHEFKVISCNDQCKYMFLFFEIQPKRSSDFITEGEMKVFSQDLSTPSVYLRRGDKGMYIYLKVKYNLLSLKPKWPEIISSLTNTIRHELEHAYDYDKQPFMGQVDPSRDMQSIEAYYTSIPEVKAYVSSIYFTAKKLHIPFEQAMDQYAQQRILNALEGQFSNVDAMWQRVRAKWLEYACQRYPMLE